MSSIFDENGKPTTIQPGNCIGFYIKGNHLVLTSVSGAGGRIKWANGDDKKTASFIKDEDDFRQLANILAETHGLSIEEDFRRPYGPAYMFVKQD